VQPSSDTGFASELVQVLNGFQQSCLSDILCVFSVSAKLASKSVNFLSVTPNFFRLHHRTIAPSGKGAFQGHRPPSRQIMQQAFKWDGKASCRAKNLSANS
jgi:hypothetical protein